MITNALWTGKSSCGWDAYVLAIMPHKEQSILAALSKDGQEPMVCYLYPTGAQNKSGKTSLDLVDFDINNLKSGFDQAIDECNKEAIVLMASGKQKEKLGAIACAERLKKLKVLIPPPKLYLIFEPEKAMWWKPNGKGYTHDRLQAGQFNEAEAFRLAQYQYIEIQPI